MRTAKEVWEAALGELQLQLTPANYKTWLKQTVGLAYQPDRFVVGASTSFATEWLQKRLYSLIKKTLIGIVGHDIEVEFQVYQRQPADATLDKETTKEGTQTANNLRLKLARFDPKYTFATFIVGSCNRFAHAAALRVVEKPGVGYNPLFIYGGVGLGKTHLLHAIGHGILGNNHRLMYVTSEQFTNQYVNAIREGKTEEFRNKYRSIDVLLIDDIHFIADKERTQETFFYTFNDLHNAGRQVVITSDRSPKSMPLLEDRLRSRFEWGLIAEIEPPDLETRLAILQFKAEQQEANVPQEVLEFIARKVQKDIRELEGSLNRVMAYARLTRTTPGLELARQALTDLPAIGKGRTLTPGVIINKVAEYFGLNPQLLQGKRRDRKIVSARQAAMYLIREEGQHPWAQIGRELGGRDHSTIMHGYEKIANEISSNAQLRRDIQQIREILYSIPG